MDRVYISKKISHFITLLSPLLIFTLKDQLYIIFIIPLFSAITELFLDYYFDKKTFSEKTKDMHSITISKDSWECNGPYQQIAWYIEKSCKMNKLSLKSFYKKSRFDNKDLTNKIPIYGPDNDLETEITYDGEIIFVIVQITSGKESTEKITLFSKSIETLKNCVKNCSEEYTTYMEQYQNISYCMFVWGNQNYRNDWGSTPINVIKNKTNVFLSEKNSKIFDSITKFHKSKKLYDTLSIAYKKGILLHGIPGSGKSSIVYAIAYEFKMNIYKVSLAGMSNSELIKQIQGIPSKSIVLFEDIDTITSMLNRENGDDTDNKNKKIEASVNLETMLNILDGYTYLHECLIFCTTNHIDKLDPALIRCGRINEKYEFTYASQKQIKEMLEYYGLVEIYAEYCDKQITTAELSQACWDHINL